ncbi:MAG: metallophosphoesterase family protein, partial [Longimicrobiales bacterium]|nr:metallophosphoesterase family protein [Longimicrobiales bacterium]
MKLLLCSDIHCDQAAARSLVQRSADADVLVCAGDLAVMRQGLQPVVDVLADAHCPAVLVPGNGESHSELEEACRGWPDAHVLHGSGCEVDGVAFWGLGGGVPVTPFGSWSYDFSEEEARELLEGCPSGGVLVTHSPPRGHVDVAGGGEHLGSRAVLEAIQRAEPALVVCGHIHACWGEESVLGTTRIINAGPVGRLVELPAAGAAC